MCSLSLTRLVQALILSAVVGSAGVARAASSSHGEAAHDAHAEAAHASDAQDAGSIKPNLKASVQRHGAHEASAEGAKAAAASEPAATEAASAASSSDVSMSDLREMIDQKIAEVRAKREAAVKAAAAKAHAKPAPKPKATAAGKRPAMQAAYVPAGDPHGIDPHGSDSHSSGPDANGHDIHWAYQGDTGPANWAMLKPDFRQCMTGRRQSPIDIRDGIPVQLDPIQFDYRPSAFRVLDNGHTVQVNVEPGNSITVVGHRYELVQFHFHRPSEERVNGRQYEMVVHLVHKDPEGHLAVVAVLIDQGQQPNPAVQQVWNNLPLEKNTEQVALAPIDPNQLLPEQRQYFTYMGSLTTPPCSEGVLWMVMKQPASLTRVQIGVFGRLYPMNARPIQQANGRLIKDGQ